MNHNTIKVAIALGSNLGNSLTILHSAVKTIGNVPEIDILSCSTWHKTKALGPPQPDYFNGCITIKTSLSPENLLKNLLDIENNFGRERKERWGARTLDLDIIFYGDLIVKTSHLEIPHPRMKERIFVLMPLAEIASYWIDPITKLMVYELLEQLL